MEIREVLRAKGREVHTVGASETVAAVSKRFADSRIRCLLVTEQDALIGLVTIRDLLVYIGQHGGDALAREVGEMMTRDVTTVAPDTPVDEAEALFADKRFNHLPVEEEGRLVGLVTPADVLVRHLEFVEEDATLLRDYISGAYH